MMKKLFAFATIFLLTFSATQASNIFYNPVEQYEEQWLVDTQGIKSYLIKKVMQKFAKELRTMDEKKLRKRVEDYIIGKNDKKAVDNFMKKRYDFADTLDNIANQYNYKTTQIRESIKNALTPYLWETLAGTISILFDLSIL